MEVRFSISFNQAYPRVPSVPRGWSSFEFKSRLGLSQPVSGRFWERRIPEPDIESNKRL